MATIEVDPDDIGTPDEPATLPSTQEAGYFTAPFAPREAQGMGAAAARPQQESIDWDQIAGPAKPKPAPKAKQEAVSWDDIVGPAPATPGNIDLAKQPRVKNPDGTYSTVDSRSYNIDGKEVLLPSVTADGRHLQTDAEILAEYKRTGKHLGIFPDAASATAYAQQLHNDYAAGKYGAGGPDAAVKEMEFGLTHPAPGGTSGVTSAPSALAAPARSGAFSPLELETIAKSAPVGQTFAPPAPPPATPPRAGFFEHQQPNANMPGGLPGVSFPGTAPVVEHVVSGAVQAGRGLAAGSKYYSQPTAQTLDAASDVMEGVSKVATPLMVVGAIMDLPGTLTVLAGSWVASKATGAGAAVVGATPEEKRFLENLAATVAAAGGAKVVWERLQPVLKSAGEAGGRAAAAAALAGKLSGEAVGSLRPVAPAASVEEAMAGERSPARPSPHAPIEAIADAGIPATDPTPVGETAGELFQTVIAPDPPPLKIAEGRDRMVPESAAPTAPAPLQDEAGRSLGPTAYAGPERRTVDAGPPTGVTDRRLPADEQVRADLKTMEGIKAAREAAEKARELPRQKNGQTTEEVEPEHLVGVKELTHTLASTQMNMPDDLAKAFRSFGGSVIKSEDLTHNGVEHTPHVTVKYGLHGDDPTAVEDLLADEPPVTVQIGKITHFAGVEDGKADAVVAEVDSPDLHRLNAKIAKALPNTETYPDYKPHITIAYVKAGKGKDYDGLNTFDGNKLTLDTLTFTTPDGQAHQIPLGGSSETTRRVAARGSKFDHPTFHALTNDEDRTLYAALHSTEGATGRFDKLGQTGATDEELKAAISASFGIQGGSGGHRPLGVRAFDYKAMPLVGGRSEANPKFWYDKAATMGGAHGKPTLEGQKLIDAVRRVMQIPTKGSAPAASPETSAPRPEFKPTWMNESDIEEAVERFKDDPVLGPAARFLNEFKDQVNRKSDGWPYWKQPGHAASRLMGVLHAYLRAGMGAYPHQPKAVAEDIWATMAPIKAFMARHGEKAGMTLPTLALEKPAAKSKPTTSASSERETYPDGRQKPIVGDKVYQTVRGFSGSPAYIHGEVYSAKGGELRVRTTGSAAVIGSAPVGKTYKLDPSWTVQGDPAIKAREEKRDREEKEKKETAEREHQEHVDAVTSKAALMVGTGKFEFLTKKTPVGARVWNEWREVWAKVDSQEDFGPALRDEEGGSDYTLGNADTDGTWAGYAVRKGAAAAATKPETKEAPSEKPASVSAEAQPAETNPHKATVTYNSARHSIEVKFPDKPPLDILHGLRSDGFKWAKTNKLWYRSLPGIAADETAPAVKKALALVKQSVGVTTAAPPVAPSKQQEDLRAMSDADLALLSARGSPASKNLALEEIARRVKEAVKKPTVIPGLKEVAISKGAAADAYEKGDRVRFLGALGTVDEKVGDLLRVKMDDGTNRIVDARKLEYVSKTPEEQGHKTEGFINTKKAEPLSAADADLLRRRLKTLTHQRNGEAERYHKLLVAKATETTRKPVLENLKAIERDLNEVWTRLNAANALPEGYEHHPETQENASARVEEKAAAAGEKAKDEGGWEWETMAPDAIMPAPKATIRVATEVGGTTISAAAARAKIDDWKAEAARVGREEDHTHEVVISLFDRTGAWSQPYVDAGYTVVRYDLAHGDDILAFVPTQDIDAIKASGHRIVGVIAAPPCTSFAVSGARWWKDQHDKADEAMVEKKYGYAASKYFDTPLEYANALVAATQLVIELANPEQFHAVENPVGRIAEQNELPKPLLTFDPANFGDPYTKKTLLWGNFKTDLPTANVEPTKGSLMHALRGDDPAQKALRSVTPEGFAYAFFMANHQAPVTFTAEELERQQADRMSDEEMAALGERIERDKAEIAAMLADEAKGASFEERLAGWTKQEAGAFLETHKKALAKAGFLPEIVGGVRKRGESANDLDIVLKPIVTTKSLDRLEEAEEAFLEHVAPSLGEDREMLNFARSTTHEPGDMVRVFVGDDWKVHAGADTIRAVEFYLPDALYQDEKPKAGGPKTDFFAKAEKALTERKALAKQLAAGADSVRLEGRDGKTALVGPDMSKPGTFRITWFDGAGEPWGHSERPSYEEAIFEALSEGYTPKKGVESTQEEASHAGTDVHRPGELPERGGRTTRAGGTRGKGALAPVLPEAGEGAGSAGPGRPGHGDSSGVTPDGVRGDAGDVEGRPAESSPRGVHVPESVSVPPAGDDHDPGVRPPDYGLTPERIRDIIGRGDVTRFADNVAAIKIIKTLEREQRWATPDEQATLAKYVGWGATEMAAYLKDYEAHDWSANEKRIWRELRELTTEEEREALIRSSPNAHFTYELYRPIWAALRAAGFTGGRILEPAVGTGHAFGFMPAEIRAASTLNAVELDPLTAAIAHHLYPSARVQAVGYEEARISRGSQDLILSNVPFGDFGITKDLLMPEFLRKRIHNYFFAKALQHVRPGGLIAFVTSKNTLDTPTYAQMRQYVMEHAEFLGAVRLPNTAFNKSAKTVVVTDVIVLRRLREGEKAQNAKLFVEARKHEGLSKELSERSYDASGRSSNVYRSSWYDAHPELVLGTESMTGTQNRRFQYTVTAKEGTDVLAAIETALGTILPPGSYESVDVEDTPDGSHAPQPVQGSYKPGELRVSADGKGVVSVDRNGETVDVTPKRLNKETGKPVVDTSAVARIHGMISIRDARNALVAAMRRPDVTEKEIKQLQGALTFAYDKFVKPDSKAPNYLNSQINKRLFKNDPEVANLLALEKVQPKATIYTDKKGKQTLRLAYTVIGKTDIFSKRTIGADPTITHVDTPKDALLASLGTHGRLDWPYMARIFGAATKKAVAALKESLVNEGLVFEQPDGAYVLAEEYLSGDVVSKLEDIEGADHPERFAKSKAALETVRPAPKTEQSVIDGQVSIGLGSHWINPADLSTFVAEQIGVSEGHVAYQIVGTSTMVRWSVASDWEAEKAATRHPLAVHYNGRHDENGNDIAGTTQSVYSFLDLVNDALNLKSPHLGHYEGRGDRRVFIREPKAELAARANQETLRAAWADYVFSHKDVLGRMLDTFNLRFNRTVPRTFDGSHMRYPGMATLYNAAGEEITFFPHQDNGIWRILSSGNTLLAHEVGAGKTFEMIAAAMEMRRTGRATKPMITVPTYLLKQWEQDIVRLYPSAKLLSFTEKDLSADKRQQAMARISHGDWDIVLVPHSSFGLLKVSDERLIAEMQRWIAELKALEDAHGTGGKKRKGDDPIKEAERQRRKLEDKVAAKMASLKDGKKDNSLTWEQLGVDAVFVDEAQAFKNLFYFTKIENVRGLSRSESDRALDLYVKLLDINEQSNYRNVVLATATPVMNSIAEIYTMQRYLQPQTLKQHGVDNFDNWYAMFAQAVPTTERQPDGSYKEVMRLRKYQNLQLLSRITREVMDYVGWEDMPYLKLPKIRGGRIRIIETDKHPMYGVVKDWFTYRMDQLRQNPPHVKRDGTYEAPERHDPLTGRGLGRFDNILTVMTDAKKAAVDLRLVLGDRVKDWEGSRLQVAADEMVAEWKREKATKGLSLVFLDMGTPKEPPPLTFLANVAVEDETEGEMDEPTDEETDALEAQVDDDDDLFNLYDALKAALVKRGIPANEIAYLHQAKNPAERVALFQAANEGRIRVLLASTDKGGVGMNVQERLSAIFELDVPRAQRPGDLRQRMGRGIRQGNLYKDVALVRFVTKDTTDEWLWGLLQTKDTQIRQFYRGDVSTLEEDDPSTMSLEEAQIRASADPRGIELTELKGKMARLEAQASAAERAVAIAKTDIGTATRMKGAIQAEKQQLEAWVASSFKTRRGKTFEMTVGGKSYTDRDDAGEALLDALRPIAKAEAKAKDATPVQVGAFGDLPIWAMFSGWDVRQPVLNKDGRPQMKDGAVVTKRDHRVQVNVWMNGSEVGSFNPSATVVATPDPTDLTQLGKGQDPIASLVNSYERLPDYRESQQKEIEEANARISQAQNVLAHPSKAIEEFRLAKDRVVAIEEELKAESIEKEKARAAAGQPPKEGEAPTELGRSVYTSGFVVPEDSGEGALTARERAAAAPTPYKTMLPEKPAAPYRAMGASEFQLITPVEETAHFWVYKNPEADKDSRWVVTHRGTGMSAYLTSTAAEAKAFAQAIDSGRFGDPAAFDFTDGASMPTEAKNIGRDALKAAKSGDLKPRQGLVEGEKGAVSLGLLPVHALAHDMIALSQWLSPKTGSSEAMLAGTDLVAHIAARDQHIVRAQRALDAARRAMDHWSHDESREFMRVMEGIAPAAALPPDQRQIAALFKQLIAQWTHEVTRRGLIHSFIQDYFPHIWEQKAQTQGILARLFFGRRPLAGREGFRKRRTIPTIEDGLAAGLTPVSWNPAVLLDAKIAEMAKSVMAHDLRHDWTKKHGLRKFVPNGMREPDGWIPDKDRGTVYGPKNATVIVNAGQTQNKVTGALAFGRLVVGQYYLHPDAARLLERFLSRGLHGRSLLFDAFNQSGNLFTQVLLGWSTFHLWMTGIESAFSKAATAVEHFSRGELGAAARQAAWVGPQGIIRDLMRGYRYVHEFYADNGDANDISGVIGQIINAGGGFTWSHYEHADAVGKFVSNMRGFFGALHRGSALDAAVKGGRAVALAPFAAIELPTKLIMEHWVPYLKAAAFMDRAEMELRRLTAQGATLEQKRYTLQRSWDIVDDRFGQLRYDNLFWNNAFKQGLMASFLSVGWNVGSLRPVGRALPGQAKRLIKAAISGGAGMPPTPPGGQPPKPPAIPAGGPYPGGFEPAPEHWLHPDIAWLATGAFMVAVAGALYHYLHTGQRPKDARDYYAPVADPETGRRVNLISYAKDYLAWERHALTTASHKVRPILTMLWETWTNEDFFGVQIYNPDDPTKKQVEDVFKSWLARANPIAWQQAVKASEDGTMLDHLKEWGGQQLSPWRPAPAEISRSAAEELLHSWGQRPTKTQEQAATAARTRTIRRGVASQAEVNWDEIAGKLTPEQIRRAVVAGARNESFLEYGFKQQPLMRALKLYEVATPEERAKLQPLLLQKMQRLSRTVPPNDVQAVMDRFGVAMDLPVAPQ